MPEGRIKSDSTRAMFLGYQIRSVNLETVRALSEIAKNAGCTMPEFYILRADWGKGILRHAEIAAHADLTLAEMTEAFQSLKQKKLIISVQNSKDDNQPSYQITEPGSQVRQRLIAKYSTMMASLCKSISQKEIEQALFVLMKMHENMHLQTEHSSVEIPIAKTKV